LPAKHVSVGEVSTQLVVRIVNQLGRLGHRSVVAAQLMFRVLQA